MVEFSSERFHHYANSNGGEVSGKVFSASKDYEDKEGNHFLCSNRVRDPV